jgi:peptidoglycan/xylan/chitin deacetylase (PgdA/CDA1 family)
MYLVKAPWWLQKLYPSFVWRMPGEEPVLYLSFDDGPNPSTTSFILKTLNQYKALATFFCVGNNVQQHHNLYEAIINEGHAVGNHTFHHVNGWKTKDKEYIEDVQEAAQWIDSSLFRPPHGRISRFQASVLQQKRHEASVSIFKFSIIMWDVLSGDFDQKLSPQECFYHVVLASKPGSIIVFHDSTKACERMQYALPKTLDYFAAQGFRFEAIKI